MIAVTLIDYMGSDLTVVNSARVSFSKVSESLDNKDIRLIDFLAKHHHWSPFAHCYAQFHIKAPIFVARQLAKHQVGLSWNEVSYRYVGPVSDEFWVPESWYEAAEDVKQGRSDRMIKSEALDMVVEEAYRSAKNSYDTLLDIGVCREQARSLLPLGCFTEWYWSGSLYAFYRVYHQRTESTAQKETSSVAESIGYHMRELFPHSWHALTTYSSQ